MTLFVQRWGKGTPAVLLHGFTGAGSSFDHLRPLFEQHFSVTAPDLPGHGASARATSWDACLDMLDEALPPRALLAGYSMGGRIALAYALRRPERVTALLLESASPGLADDAERAERVREDEQLATLLEEQGLDAFLARWEAVPVLRSLHALPTPLAQALRARRQAQSAAGLASALRALGTGAQPPLWAGLGSLRVPTLLLCGEEDGKFLALARRMYGLLPRAQVRAIARCGHTPHLEAPKAYAGALLELRDTIEGSRT